MNPYDVEFEARVKLNNALFDFMRKEGEDAFERNFAETLMWRMFDSAMLI